MSKIGKLRLMIDFFDFFYFLFKIDQKIQKNVPLITSFNKEDILYIIIMFHDVHIVLFHKMRNYFNADTFCYVRDRKRVALLFELEFENNVNISNVKGDCFICLHNQALLYIETSILCFWCSIFLTWTFYLLHTQSIYDKLKSILDTFIILSRNFNLEFHL